MMITFHRRVDFEDGEHFTEDEYFEVKIVVQESVYEIYINDVKLGKDFPQRQNISLATQASAIDGSTATWTSLALPSKVYGS